MKALKGSLIRKHHYGSIFEFGRWSSYLCMEKKGSKNKTHEKTHQLTINRKMTDEHIIYRKSGNDRSVCANELNKSLYRVYRYGSFAHKRYFHFYFAHFRSHWKN